MPVWINSEQVEDAVIRQERKLVRERLYQEWPTKGVQEIESKARDWAFENVVERVLLRQAAFEFVSMSAPSADSTICSTGMFGEGPSALGDVPWQVDAFLKHLTKDVPKPTAREVSDNYRKNGKLFLLPERAHASHIVRNVNEGTSESEARSRIEKAERELVGGKSFAEVADEYSDCPGSGGDLSWFSRGEMVEEFEAVVFALKPSQVSPIFRSSFGFHLVQLHERRPSGIPPLREVYSRVEENIIKLRHEEILAHFLDEVRLKADIRNTYSMGSGSIS